MTKVYISYQSCITSIYILYICKSWCNRSDNTQAYWYLSKLIWVVNVCKLKNFYFHYLFSLRIKNVVLWMFLSFKIIVYVCWLLSYNYFVSMGSMSTASHQVLVFPPFGFFFYLFELLFLFCFITGVYTPVAYINTFFLVLVWIRIIK